MMECMATIAEALAIALEHHRAGRLQAAEPIYRQILEVVPSHPDAWHLLGVIAHQVGQHATAVEQIQRALEVSPGHAEAHYHLGQAYRALQKVNEAVGCFQRAAQLRPDYAQAHTGLGNVLHEQGRLEEAAAAYRQALQLNPADVVAHNNLGNVLYDQRLLDEAVACYERALELNPDFAVAHSNLGNVRYDQGRLDEAAASFEQALRLEPDVAEVHFNLGVVRKDQGLLDDAIACHQRALQLKPDFAMAHGNLVYILNFCPESSPQATYEELRRWNRLYAAPLARFIHPHANDCSPDRRLRIGYVSPDFRVHPVGRFMLPLLASHDRSRFEIFCYASIKFPDPMTERCRLLADVWRDISGVSDEEAAAIIRRDAIDILVDLTMHMTNNRLLIFARKPAPVQVTYLAYCGTTGIDAIDYRLTDPYLDPGDRNERYYSEETIRLPETYWCYHAPDEAPPVNPLPAFETGHVTFGCLNNFCKVTNATLGTWSRILQAVPQSRLLLHAREGSHRNRVRDFFARQNITSDRLTFVGLVPVPEYFRIYERIDVGLDPFPYGGGTTTCDSLWMGVPVVSLVGEAAVGRGGLSILSNAGLPDLAAYDADQYVRIAVELASDLPRLVTLRATLRGRLQSSILMNAPRFARNIEAACRGLWQRWCAKQEPRASA